ncbi:acylphosphatase [Candidatus Bipolaricaulota bacterium]|nr:acylphosphatase [Candidatus Bipolaricaulota bacterium]
MTETANQAEAARLEAVVHGIVQGVFFRYNTKREADRLGLTGTVRNRPDGTVRVDAAGPRQSLQDLLEWLREGPEHAVVERVDVTWHSAASASDGFRITY